MPDINITFTPNLSKVSGALKAIKLGAELQNLIKEVAFGVEAEAKKSFTGFSPVPIITGTLRRSITTSIGNLKASIAPHVNYAIYVHEGLGSSRKYGRRPFMEEGLERAQKLGLGSKMFLVQLDKKIQEAVK